MAAFFGVNGALFEVKCPASADRVSERGVSFTRTLGGKRKAFVGRGSRRSWSLDVGAGTPQDVSTVEALSREPGPLVFISPEAAVGNLLSPQASGFEPAPPNATEAGVVALPDGTVARSVASSSSVSVGDVHGNYERVPVLAGSQVTVGAWALGRLGFQGFWYDATGSSITTYLHSSVAVTGWGWREVTMTPPAGAAFVSLNIFGGAQYARPVVSWGSGAQDRPGRGAPRVVVHGLSEALTVISNDDAYGSVDVTITEVG